MLVHKVMKITSLDGMNRQILDLSQQDLDDVMRLARSFTREKLIYHIKLLEDAYITMNKSEVKRMTAEIALMRMAYVKYDSSYEALEARISELENKLLSGDFVARSASSDKKREDSSPKPTKIDTVPTDKSETVATPKPKEASASKGEQSLPEWVDIMDSYASQNPSTSSFMKNAKATYSPDNKRLTVWVAEGFAKMMLDNAGVATAIIPIAKRHGIHLDQVVISLIPKSIASNDPLSDLL
jgi:DNA polymerase III gamma/tau subunit